MPSMIPELTEPRKLLYAAFVVAALSMGCSPSTEPSSAVKGSANDATVTAGLYEGYRIIRPCSRADGAVGVRGLGGLKLEEVADIARAGGELYEALGGLPSVHGGGGYGLGCEEGVIGTNVFMNDWREVDEAVSIVSQLLVERGWDVEVEISVSSIPVAH